MESGRESHQRTRNNIEENPDVWEHITTVEIPSLPGQQQDADYQEKMQAELNAVDPSTEISIPKIMATQEDDIKPEELEEINEVEK